MPTLNLPHRMRLPNDASRLAPAIVMVHGWLGNENSMWAFEKALPPDALAVSMRAPFAVDNGYSWMLPGATGRRDGSDAESFNAGLAALREFVAALPSAYSVDPEKVVLMGFSQGAAISLALLLSEPSIAAAAAVLSGFLPPPARHWAVPGRLSGKSIFIAHGTVDRDVPHAAAVLTRDALTQTGAGITYREYVVGHKMTAQGMRDLTAWLTEVARA